MQPNTITPEEREKILSQYIKDGKLIAWPGKPHKRKETVLSKAAELFTEGRDYTEKDVMSILMPFYEQDPFLIRRGLIDYGFLKRERDGSRYWVPGKNDD